MYVYNHCIGGIHFRTEMDLYIPWVGNSPLRAFVQDGVDPDVRLRLSCIFPDAASHPTLDPQVLARLQQCVGFNPQYLDSPLLRSAAVYACLQGMVNHSEQVGLEIKRSSVAIFDLHRHELNLFISCDEDNNYTHNQLGAALFAPFLIDFSAAMIHSAGLIYGNCAAVFLAPDEGGKTTVVNQADAECRGVLSDDQVILRQTDGVLTAHGTPWSRFTDGPLSARLGGLFLLEQAERFELTPLPAVAALGNIWNEHQGYWYILPKAARVQAFNFIYAICHQVPAYRMRFPRDYVDWNAIRMACQ